MVDSCCSNIVVTNETTSVITVTNETTSVIVAGGEQGPPGISASTSIIITAGENLSGGAPVVLINGKAYKAVNTAIEQANKIIGVTKGSISLDRTGLVLGYGELNGFNGLISDAPVYVSEMGTLVSTLPISGYIQQIGIALNSTTILINIQPSLILG
jgi:hypothetical protein